MFVGCPTDLAAFDWSLPSSAFVSKGVLSLGGGEKSLCQEAVKNIVVFAQSHLELKKEEAK